MVRKVKTDPSMAETFHLLKTPANVKHLGKSLKQYRQGQRKTKALVDAKEVGNTNSSLFPQRKSAPQGASL
jgi:hypothetical protein